VEAGSLTYEPDSNFYGADTLTYIISDGKTAAAEGTVLITIAEINEKIRKKECNHPIRLIFTTSGGGHPN